MRRFARHVLTLLAVLSVLLFVATIAAWVQSTSTRTNHRLRWVEGRTVRTYDINWQAGILQVGRMTIWDYPEAMPDGWTYTAESIPHYAGALFKTEFSYFDRQWVYDTSRGAQRMTQSIEVPIWFVTLLFLILPVVWTIAWLRRRRVALRVRQGLCVACGYDLRESPSRCPECGTNISTA